MTKITSNIKSIDEIREAFLSYFEQAQHKRLSSSSLVPANDPTLLFTNAGMVQFKDVFLGDEPRDYVRATSSQRCVRAGGKHNDLENVGYTARHHTFFEMLGNFSFGDYFKTDAIPLAWKFLTETLSIPSEKLWVTIYADDDEAFDIWHKNVGLAAERIIRIGDNKGEHYASDNFWSMGDVGPCGPCSEIFYDHGEHIKGGLPGTPEEDGDRYIEIWNIVFMQFNRSADGSMQPLPKPSVDTGMGLERVAAIMQGVNSNYDIDLFQSLLTAIASELNIKDTGQSSLRVIADHIRSCAFLIADGVILSNEGRGYVLRRIIRRAIRHGNKLGANSLFFWRLVAPLEKAMGQAYPELSERQQVIEQALKAEEQQFALTLEQGMKILERDLESVKGDVISGETAFKLYDTYGFPLDLTADIARERNMTVDITGYETAMEKQRSRAKAASQFKTVGVEKLKLDSATVFNGYKQLNAPATVKAIFVDGTEVTSINSGDEAIMVLDQTTFYAESGGQAGDIGKIYADNNCFDVIDTQKQGDAFLHRGVVSYGKLQYGLNVSTEVNSNARNATALNHSATHLLHAALKQVLGEHVVQKGSLVNAERLRFDFAHTQAMSIKELHAVAAIVNQQIRNNTAVSTEIMDMAAAKEVGATALFGEKYGNEVRVLTMGGSHFSVELCGGTHVERTGDIGFLRILAESGIASGVRRIEAVTGAKALADVQANDQALADIANLLKSPSAEIVFKLQQLLDNQKNLDKKVQQLQQKLASGAGNDLAASATKVNDVSVLVSCLTDVDAKSLRDTSDQLKQKLGKSVIVLATVVDTKISLVSTVSDDLTNAIKAGDIIKALSAAVGGKGGGRPDFAQGGGSNTGALNNALEESKQFILSCL